jgi:acyl-CoA synthetase (AMP-forming)/AMP-acid ligase II/acyl carrier protein
MSHSFQSTPAETLVELLRWQTERQPQQRAYTFLVDGETEAIDLTYAELDQQARAIGAWLQQMGAVGQRVILIYPPGLEFIAAFFGCLYAGAVAVPAPPPQNQPAMRRLAAIVANVQTSLLLTTSSLSTQMQGWLDETPNLKQIRWLTSDAVPGDLARTWQNPAVTGNSLAMLQYTSGSTSAPKGVMLTHRHLTGNVSSVIRSFNLKPEEHGEGVCWIPPYHNLGLMGIVLVVYTGHPMTFMPPVAFIQKPFRWLQAISRAKATISPGPNFAYGLCVDHITVGQQAELDLSSWQLAIIGSEPIRHKTLERFAAAFSPCGFRKQAFCPGYGVAEATLIISTGAKMAPPVTYTVQSAVLKNNRIAAASPGEPSSQTVVGCGQVLLEHRVVITNPETSTPCAVDQVGEIWVSGPSVAQGYWHQPEETERAFQAYLANGDGPFLRTGDLGFLKDGELFITGRLKDLIIIRGRNYYPQDIELVAEESHPALRYNSGAAFSVDVDDQEQLVIVFELERRQRKADVEEVAAAVRAAVAQVYGLETYAVVLIKTGHLPRTTSGKIQRYQCRQQFLEETLPVMGVSIRGQAKASLKTSGAKTAADPELQQVREQLITQVQTQLAEFLKVPPDQVDLQQSIQNLGLGSLHATAVKYQLEENFGIDLSPEIFFEDITLDQFVTKIAIQATSERGN